MIDTRVLSHDAESGITEYFHWDDADDTFTIERVQSVGGVVERAKRLHSAASSDWKGEMHHVAEIPMSVYADLQKQGILQDQARFRAWLNERDNQVFRTRGGRV